MTTGFRTPKARLCAEPSNWCGESSGDQGRESNGDLEGGCEMHYSGIEMVQFEVV